ncbi:MAG: hypothetical protein ABIP20_20120 [Chthoniobacteraceae bacterium]
MCAYSTIATAALLLFVTADANATPPFAFPGAEGAGANASGGRGGAVVHVTNLNASGPGSFADAVSQPNRIVVFNVSGIIDLNVGKSGKTKKDGKGGTIEIAQPNITIAGQTAPGEGICVKGGVIQIAANNIILRHIRSRRGFVTEGTQGDAIEVKPTKSDERAAPRGQSRAAFDKKAKKKAERGKSVRRFSDLDDIVIDHCSASWATDENLTVTHTGRATISYSIAAEGLDYTNPSQTPPNHSEGSLWGSSAPDGRSTMHHMLYAHNRLRNPRTTGGAEVPAVLTFYNSVVYDWSEYPTHTGSERVHLQWLNNFYKPGPSTPADIRSSAFQFHGDPLARLFASGNMIDGSPEGTKDNRLAVGWQPKKFKDASDAEKAAMIVEKPWTAMPANLQSASEAYETVLMESGATLPARDAVDLRIVNSVRNGTGKVIQKETDFPENERWPDYRSLPPPKDSDGDGLPDFWEKQFGLNPNDATDSAQISDGGYANIEHWFNNTDPTGGSTPILFVSASVSRAGKGQNGEWRVTRTGDTAQPLTVRYSIGGDAVGDKDFAQLAGSVTIPAGKTSAAISLSPLATANGNKTAVISITAEQPAYHVGCPSQSLIVIRK